MTSPKVTVAIPTYQRGAVLIDTLKSVLKQEFEDFEVIVVDQTKGKTKEIDPFLRQTDDGRIRYFAVTPPSLPAARNFAISKSKSDIIIFIDDDVILEKNFIGQHYHLHTSRNDIKAVAGRITHEGSEPSEKLFHFDWFGFENHSFNFPEPQEATAFQGCNFSVKKEIAEKLSGFDTNYTKSSLREESDFAFRIRKEGYKIWYEPKATLYHLWAPSGGCRIHKPQRDSLSFYENDLYFSLKTKPAVVWPVVLSVKYLRYVSARSMPVYIQRTKLFLKGLRYAISRKFSGKVIIQNPVD
ncbi:MAG: glycosyltransferase family 2 protein [Balneolaceae bacterium]|nr:glycosyltransferase family 2 protein [Balneolaceae bacterium]